MIVFFNELRSLVNYGYASQRDWLSYGSGGSSSPNCGLACFYFGNIPSNAHYWTSTLEAGAVGKARVFQNEGSISLTQSTTTGTSRLFPVRGGM